MAEKLNFGCISEYRTQFYVEWKIRDYLEIDQKPDVRCASRLFPLFDSQLRLCLEPRMYRDEDLYILLGLGKIKPQDQFGISCTLGIKARDGRIYKFTHCGETFQFINQGIFASVKRSDILNNKSILDVHGGVTFFCSIRYPEDKAFDAGSQTLPHDDQSTLCQDFKNLFLSETCSDVTIKVQDQEIRAHSQILAARCSVFESMFTHEMKEKETGVVKVEDCDPAAFREFVSFLYSGETANMSFDNVMDVYAIANKYNMAGLMTRCLEFMKERLCIGSFCDVYSMAINFEENELIQYATEFFLKKGKQILKTLEWLTFVKEFPLQSNDLVIKFAEHLSK